MWVLQKALGFGQDASSAIPTPAASFSEGEDNLIAGFCSPTMWPSLFKDLAGNIQYYVGLNRVVMHGPNLT